ncbi:MAG: PAC2 family protein [Ancrocorticia sp.]
MHLENLTSLRDPIAILALAGWADAGNAGCDLAEYLTDRYPGEEIARIDDERFYNFQENRPIQRLRADGVTIDWPHVTVSVVHMEDRDVVVAHGVEPNLMWRTFTQQMLDVLIQCKVSTVIILGAQLVDTPHTRDFPCGVYATSPEVAASHPGIDLTEYTGPTSALGVLAQRLDEEKIPAAQVWVSIPHYVVEPPNPKAQLTLIEAIEETFGIAFDTSDLPTRTTEWEEGISRLTSQTADISTYVAELETAYDEEVAEESNGQQVMQEIEDFLRGLSDEPDPVDDESKPDGEHLGSENPDGAPTV